MVSWNIRMPHREVCGFKDIYNGKSIRFSHSFHGVRGLKTESVYKLYHSVVSHSAFRVRGFKNVRGEQRRIAPLWCVD